MKLKFYFFLIILFLLPALACSTANVGQTVTGSGNIISKDYDVKGFSRITLAGSGNVYITQGSTASLSVETDDNIFAQLDIRVRGDELILGTKPAVGINPSQPIKYQLTVKDLNNITLGGSGNMYSDPIQTDNMQVMLGGSGNIEVKGMSGRNLSVNLGGSGNITINQINASSVDTSINGSGNIKLDGKVDGQTVSVNGSGKYMAGDLETANANIKINGSGNLTLWAKETLDVHVNGSGDVSYYGQPTINQTGGGSGKLLSLGEK